MFRLLLISVLALFPTYASAKVFHVLGQKSSPIPRIDKRLELATSWCFFAYDPNTQKYDYSAVNPAIVKQTATNWPPNTIMVIDIENFPNTPEGNAQLVKTFEIVRQTNPSIRFGIYGEWPSQQYWSRVPYLIDVAGLAKGVEPARLHTNQFNYDAMQANEARRFYFSKYVDIVMPSCYTFYRTTTLSVATDPQVVNWEHFCRSQIQQARQANKDVYVYLWPVYHSVSPTKLVEGEYFRRQLDLAYAEADGIVLFEGLLNTVSGAYTAGWAKELVAFLDAKGLYK